MDIQELCKAGCIFNTSRASPLVMREVLVKQGVGPRFVIMLFECFGAATALSFAGMP